MRQARHAGNAHKTAKTVRAYAADAHAVITICRELRDAKRQRSGAMGVGSGATAPFDARFDQRVAPRAAVLADRSAHKGSSDAAATTLSRGSERNRRRGRGGTPGSAHPGRRPIEGVIARRVERGSPLTWHELNGRHAFMRDEGPRTTRRSRSSATGSRRPLSIRM